MPLSAGFYRRRLHERLALDDGPPGAQRPTKRMTSEKSLLTIPDDTEFVRQVYLFFLKREPDLDGLQYYAREVLSRGRQAVLDGLKFSVEGQANDTAPASAEEDRSDDSRILAMGRPFELTDLLRIDGDEAFISQLYEEALCRPVDPAGLAHHLTRLSEGATRESLTKGLALSPEAQRIGRPFTWAGRPWPPVSRLDRVRHAFRRTLLGTDPSADTARDRVNERLLHLFAEERRTLARVEHVVAGIPQAMAQALRTHTQTSDATHERLARLERDIAVLQRTVNEVRSHVLASARTTVVTGDNVVATEVNGFIVGVPVEEWRLAAFHAFRGVLEPGLTRRFTDTLASGMTVVDVGANVGMYTLVAARAVAPDGRVYSFEPTPRTFAILKDNIQVNGLLESGVVDCRQMAVTDRRGTARLAMYHDNGGHNTLFADGSGPEFMEVQTVALDDALADVPRVDVIKIDAEGAESLVWDGMSRTLRQNPAVKVFMEFAPSLLSRAGQNPGDFLDRLKADGFRIQRVHDESGALVNESREELCSAFSVNLLVTSAGAR